MQTICKELSLPVPTSVINNTDATVTQLLAFLERAGKEARSDYRWPEMNREFTWTLVNGQANYAFNADYEYQAFRTHWDRTNKWELIGPVSEQEWQWIKSGVITSTPRRRFRIKGVADNQIFIDPTPSSDGNTLVLEYQSMNWIRPKTWAASTAFAAGSYCFYNGNYYSTTLGGVTGATAPTHTSGSQSDGGITWAYYSGIYDTFTADTDVPLLNDNCLVMDVKWRFRHEKQLEWQSFRKDAEDSWRKHSMDKKGSEVLTLTPSRTNFLITTRNVPDTGYGS